MLACVKDASSGVKKYGLCVWNWSTYKDIKEGGGVVVMDDFFFQAVPDGVGELQQEQRQESHTLVGPTLNPVFKHRQ